MARQAAIPHNQHSLRELADELKDIANALDDAAAKFVEEEFSTPMLVDNQAKVDQAVIELSKLRRSVEKEILDRIDEKLWRAKTEQRRAEMHQS